MISAFRNRLDSWVVRAFFMLLVGVFVVWGIGDVIRNINREAPWVAKVGDQTVEPPILQEAYQRQMQEVQRRLGGQTDPGPEIKRAVLRQALDRIIAQIAVAQQEQRLGVMVPQSALRQAVYDIPAFKGPDGKFDQQKFRGELARAGLTEGRLTQMVAADLGNRQILEAVRIGVAPSDALARLAYAVQAEKRSADVVELPFADAAAPEPTQAELERWHDNHPARFSTPELRKIKAVILSPQTLAKEVEVTDAEVRSAYDLHKSQFGTPEKRSAEIVMLPDEARAQSLAQQWRAGADWAAIQAAAKDAGGTAVDLADAGRSEFPSPDLADAVFAAPENAVSDPARDPLGWRVLKVSKILPGTERSFDEVKDELRDRILAERATDLLYDRANKIDNLLGTGAGLEELPNDLGLTAVAGTLDAAGNTAEGTPAPIPGPPELRQAIIAAAFQAQAGDPPRLTEVRTPSNAGSAYYALTLDSVTPAAVKPYAEVAEQVRADWERDARRRAQDQEAAKLLAAVKDGQSLEETAAAAGKSVRRTPSISRGAPADGVGPELAQAIFALKKGEPTMVETPEGFVVASLAEAEKPDPSADPSGYARMRDALAIALGNDAEFAYANALRERVKPKINDQLLNAMIQN